MSLNYGGLLTYYNGVHHSTDIYDISHNDADENGLADAGEQYEGSPDRYVGTVTIQGEVYPVYEYIYGTGTVSNTVAFGGDAPPMPATTDIPQTLPAIISEQFCLLAGTTIQMAGEKCSATVESLRKGDVIVSKDGNEVQALWIGRQKVSTRFGFAERLQPVRIQAGALGDNVPNEDLTVSNDHALFVDGILANAGALVNDLSIFRVPLDEFEDGTFTYYHIETEKHELILANNTPAETFIDNVSRQSFDNYQEYVDLYGEEREMDELPIPRAMSPRQLPKKIKARLAARAEALGYDKKAAA